MIMMTRAILPSFCALLLPPPENLALALAPTWTNGLALEVNVGRQGLV